MKYTTAVFPKYGEPTGQGNRRNRRDYLQPMADRFTWDPIDFPMISDELEARRNRIIRMAACVRWAEVDKSLRWAPRRNDDGKIIATYCDHYTWDFLQQLLNAYPPVASLLWWTGDNEAKALAGENVPVVYPRAGVTGTVREYSATDLARWLEQYAEDFGWVRFDSAEALQAHLDEHATVGIVCAERVSKGSSHVTVALPSLVATALKWENPEDHTGVLQTEAGANTFPLTRRTWYAGRWKKVHFLALPSTFLDPVTKD